jgi:dTDP-4-dehydrorhamnose 3,5-epimerase
VGADLASPGLFEVQETLLPGAFVLKPRRLLDARGSLTKLFHADAFADLGLPGDFRELFTTWSGRHVLRGLHFQAPPAAQAKLVTCLTGSVFDVLLDVRRGSPTYGLHFSAELGDERGDLLYVPEGVAHGFAVLTAPALLLYAASRVHVPSSDAGVRWDSAGVQWPTGDPLLSDRDRRLPALAELESPFVFDQTLAAPTAPPLRP